ncbi:MAG: hypothetical protein IPO80_09275 [Propionibacteriaceae bacterium]|nr:hypothetical protein [Propionibacteriaceae bacterium]
MADDAAGIYSNVKLTVSSITTNDGGVHALGAALDLLVDPTYQSSQGLQSLVFGNTVLLADGSVYQWMGPNTPTLVDLLTADYEDLGYWKPVGSTDYFPQGFNVTTSPSVAVAAVVVLNDVRSDVAASVTDAEIEVHDLLVQAREEAFIRADVDVTATASGGSSFSGGLALAANGIIATNRVLGGASATVAASVVNATGDIVVDASNVAEILASVRAAMAGSATAIGVILAFNTIGWQPTNVFFATVDALIGDPLIQNEAFNGETPVEANATLANTPVTAGGAVHVTAVTAATIRASVGNDATSAPATLFGFGAMNAAGVLTANRVSSGANASIIDGDLPGDLTLASNPALLAPGDRVRLSAGETYEFVGAGRAPPAGGLANEDFSSADWRRVDLVIAAGVTVEAHNNATIESTSTLRSEVSSDSDAASGILNQWAADVLGDYEYTSNSGTQDLAFGDRVRAADDYGNAAAAGRVYQWMGTPQTVNLAGTDYTDYALWKELTPTNLVNDSMSYEDLASRAVWLQTLFLGGAGSTTFVLLTTNTVNSAVVASIEGTEIAAAGAVAVIAADAASIIANDSSEVSGGGSGAVIVSNVVLSTAQALVTRSPITTTAGGDLSVSADQNGRIDATATTRIEDGDGTSAILAFNSIGWTPTNIVFGAIEAFLGETQDWGSEQPAQALALITNSALDIAGSISVQATSATQINASAENANNVAAIAGVVLPEAGQQGSVTGFGQNASVTGLILASNKVSSQARAAIAFTNARGEVTAGGDVTIQSLDAAGITSGIILVQSAEAQNDPTKLVQTVNDELLPNDYDYTTASGTQTLVQGDRVRLGAGYAGGGLAGSVYEFLGATGTLVPLGSANYGDALLWDRLEAGADNLDSLYPGIGSITLSKAKAMGILVAMNDVRGAVTATLTNAEVVAGGDVTVSAIEDALLTAEATSTVGALSDSPIGFGFLLGLLFNGSAKSIQIVTNVVLSSATASVSDSSVEAASLTVEAANRSGIDATLQSTAATTTTALGATLAFNLLGWKPQNIFENTLDTFLGQSPADETQPAAAVASLIDSEVVLTGDLIVSAVNAAILNATVSNAASSAADGLFLVTGGTKNAIFASNKVASRAEALVERSQVTAGGAMTVLASDDAGVYSNVKIVGSSVTTNSGAIDVISGQVKSAVDADFASSEIASVLSFGDRVRIDSNFGSPVATTSSIGRQPVALAAGDNVELHAGYAASTLTTASGIRLLTLGDNVTVDKGYLAGGDWGVTYRYVGPNARLDLGSVDYRNRALWKPVGGNAGGVYAYLGPDATIDINSTDFGDTSVWTELAGTAGTVYEYLGQTATNVNLATQNYTDLGYWRPVAETQIFPTFNITNSDSSAMGGTIVLNDVVSTVESSVVDSTVTTGSLEVRAREQAVIRAVADVTTSSSGGSSWDGQGTSSAISAVIATNRVLGSATASISDSTVTTRTDDPATAADENTSGDLAVSAENLSVIDATNLVAAASGAKSVGLVLAFNTVGWNPSPTFFALIDALIGDPLISDAYDGENPVATLAFITGTPLTVAGDLLVSATTDAKINALVSNAATSAPAALFGAGGTSVGMVVSSNKVSATAGAYVAADPSATGLLNVSAGGAVEVIAVNSSVITANTAMYGEVSPTNDAGAGIINNFAQLLLDQYDYTNRSGVKSLVFGDKVRVAEDFAGTYVVDPAFDAAGKVFEWMGLDGAPVDLGTQDYSDFELWKELTPTNLINGSLTYAILSEAGTALKKDGLVGWTRTSSTARSPQAAMSW